MCDLMKIQSSFICRGEHYKVHFTKVNGRLTPVLEKMAFKFLNYKFWKKTVVGEQKSLSNDDVEVLSRKPPLQVIDYLRNFARKASFNKNDTFV